MNRAENPDHCDSIEIGHGLAGGGRTTPAVELTPMSPRPEDATLLAGKPPAEKQPVRRKLATIEGVMLSLVKFTRPQGRLVVGCP